eukprot:scaffold20587_cov110-Isochrysis_galbana.AAC.7
MLRTGRTYMCYAHALHVEQLTSSNIDALLVHFSGPRVVPSQGAPRAVPRPKDRKCCRGWSSVSA